MMTLNSLQAILRGQWSHIEAVVRGQVPYWFTAMRQWTPQEVIYWGAVLMVSLATVRTCWRCK
jgi:hypothetical protein